MIITIDARMLGNSGIGVVTKNILERIVLIKTNWHFNILADPHKTLEIWKKTPNNVTIIPCLVPIYSLREQFYLLSKIPKNTNVLFVPHYNIPVLFPGKIVSIVHDVCHLAMPECFPGLLKQLYAKTMFYLLAKRAKTVITDSQFTAEELQKYTAIDTSKIRVIHIAPDAFWLDPPSYLIPLEEKTDILFVGNVKPHKNIRTLIKAFIKIQSNIPGNLLIVGQKDGFITGDNEVGKLIENQPRILFTGKISQKKLKHLYSTARIFVFPSLYEGFGLPPLEALACGCPRVLCSRIEATQEVCGNFVEYFNSTDSDGLAAKLLTSFSETEHVSMNPRKLLDRYSWDTTVENYISVIEDSSHQSS